MTSISKPIRPKPSKSSPVKLGVFKKKGYVIVTAGFFIISITAHWIFAWYAYVDEAVTHAQAIQVQAYFVETMRDTMENWQSEFLQLIWQVGGLSFLWYVGSNQSKNESERVEEKIDYIIKQLKPENAEMILKDLENKYPKK